MKRVLTTLLLTIFATAISVAQPSLEIRESLKRNPLLTFATYATYPAAELQPVVEAPDGFEPFYLSNVSRHGSRYQNVPNAKFFAQRLALYAKLNRAGLLTPYGKEIYKRIETANRVQGKQIGELSPLGARQLYATGERTFARFGEIFKGEGEIYAISSTYTRCIESMQNFTKALCDKNPSLKVAHSWDAKYQHILRPYSDWAKVYTPKMQREFERHTNRGAWIDDLAAWAAKQECDAAVKLILTDVEQGLKCVKMSSFELAYETFSALSFALNFEVGDVALLTKLFTLEDMYKFNLHKNYEWACHRSCEGEGMEIMDLRHAHIRPFLMMIINEADAVIEGKSKLKANLRFTHDTNVMPLLAAMGYEGTMMTYTKDVEKSSSSINLSEIIPMGANLQLVLYRNKQGEVLVRSLLNELDIALPIKSVAPYFYKWSDVRALFLARLAAFDAKVEANSVKK